MLTPLRAMLLPDARPSLASRSSRPPTVAPKATATTRQNTGRKRNAKQARPPFDDGLQNGNDTFNGLQCLFCLPLPCFYAAPAAAMLLPLLNRRGRHVTAMLLPCHGLSRGFVRVQRYEGLKTRPNVTPDSAFVTVPTRPNQIRAAFERIWDRGNRIGARFRFQQMWAASSKRGVEPDYIMDGNRLTEAGGAAMEASVIRVNWVHNRDAYVASQPHADSTHVPHATPVTAEKIDETLPSFERGASNNKMWRRRGRLLILLSLLLLATTLASQHRDEGDVRCVRDAKVPRASDHAPETWNSGQPLRTNMGAFVEGFPRYWETLQDHDRHQLI